MDEWLKKLMTKKQMLLKLDGTPIEEIIKKRFSGKQMLSLLRTEYEEDIVWSKLTGNNWAELILEDKSYAAKAPYEKMNFRDANMHNDALLFVWRLTEQLDLFAMHIDGSKLDIEQLTRLTAGYWRICAETDHLKAEWLKHVKPNLAALGWYSKALMSAHHPELLSKEEALATVAADQVSMFNSQYDELKQREDFRAKARIEWEAKYGTK